MGFHSLAAAICFISCHGGPADHFCSFADDLARKGHRVEIYATGPALQKCKERQSQFVIPFSLEEESANEMAIKCGRADAVITDVGHPFDVSLQEALAANAPKAVRFAYYDNPESYVPGGYSATAAKVMRAAQKVLFANANLADEPIEEVDLAQEQKIPVGYYPIAHALKLREKRGLEREAIRGKILSELGVEESGQKIWVYAGGNNEEYFQKAFPAFLRFLAETSDTLDLSNEILLLQQHPGAREKNRDRMLLEEWVDEYGKREGAPRLIVSKLNSDEAQIGADQILYYQTSMGPQFVLAGIPTIQVGHELYRDILVKNELCRTAISAAQLENALFRLGEGASLKSDDQVIQSGLGIRSDWEDRLERALVPPFQRE